MHELKWKAGMGLKGAAFAPSVRFATGYGSTVGDKTGGCEIISTYTIARYTNADLETEQGKACANVECKAAYDREIGTTKERCDHKEMGNTKKLCADRWMFLDGEIDINTDWHSPRCAAFGPGAGISSYLTEGKDKAVQVVSSACGRRGGKNHSYLSSHNSLHNLQTAVHTDRTIDSIEQVQERSASVAEQIGQPEANRSRNMLWNAGRSRRRGPSVSTRAFARQTANPQPRQAGGRGRKLACISSTGQWVGGWGRIRQVFILSEGTAIVRLLAEGDPVWQ